MGWFGHQAGVYFFQYDPQWMMGDEAFVLAPQFGFREEAYTGNEVRTFFANLLPEGVALEEILGAMFLRNANVLEIIGQLGAELPGALSLLPEGQQPAEANQYSSLGFEEMSRRILAREQQNPLLISNQQSSLSLPGAQDKLGLRYDSLRGVLYDSVGTTPTTHIAKPDSRLKQYQPSALNEYLSMKLAEALKLPVPVVDLIQVPQTVYLVQRYDREVVGDRVNCLHQIDACQLLGVGSEWKYERQGGFVSLKKIVAALRKLQLPGSAFLNLQRWVMFNYLIGNSDAHAKNISVLVGKSGYELAPFYDLLSVQVYGDEELALFIGDEQTYATVGAHSWETFCEDCGFSYKPVRAMFRKMAQDLPVAWQKVTGAALKRFELSVAEKKLIQDMSAVIDQNIQAALSMTLVEKP
jgi:serine/threonine-protein kinase HipA